MSGTCFKYKDKLILWDSGQGDPWYVYTIFPKGSRDKNGFLDGVGIKFGYNKQEDQEKTLSKVKEYIDTHYDEIMDCGNNLDPNSINFCLCSCDIFKDK